MKKQVTPFLLITAVGLFLSSCSNVSKISLTKRHYRSGYCVDFVRKIPASTSSHIAKKPIKADYQMLPSVIPTKHECDAIVQMPKVATEKSNSVQKRISIKTWKTNDTKAVNYISSRSYESKENISVGHISNAEGDNEVRARVDVNIPFIIIILCAIFIPPLGVGLMYGINSYFWIDLILTLLFFFPGMIFALIVVLM